MIIETYREKVTTIPTPGSKSMRIVDSGNYELHNRSTISNGGWKSDAEFWEERSDWPGYVGEIWSEEHQCSAFKFDQGRQWGIRSYQLVYPCLEENQWK